MVMTVIAAVRRERGRGAKTRIISPSREGRAKVPMTATQTKKKQERQNQLEAHNAGVSLSVLLF